MTCRLADYLSPRARSRLRRVRLVEELCRGHRMADGRRRVQQQHQYGAVCGRRDISGEEVRHNSHDISLTIVRMDVSNPN